MTSRFAVHAVGLFGLTLGTCLVAATIPETTPADDNQVNGNCTLREAITAAQSNAPVDLCPAGSAVDPDLVLLLAGPHSWTLGQVFQSSGGPLILRGPTTAPPTALVNIDPVTSQRFMRLLNGADVTIENVDLRNGDTRLNPSTRTGGALTATDLASVSLTLRNVVLLGNRAAFGGGLYFETSNGGSGSLVIERSVIQANLAEINDVVGTARGGGLFLQLRGATSARLVDSTILANRVDSTLAGNEAWAGGIYVALSGAATFEMRRVEIADNEADAGPGITPIGAGAVLFPWGETTMRIEDVRFESNNLVDPFLAASGYPPSALDVNAAFNGSFALDRIAIVGHDDGEAAVDLRLQHSSPAPALARNILVAHGAQRGAQVSNSGELTLAHWTVTGHANEGLRLGQSGATLRLDNSLLWGNGTDLVQTGAPTVDPSNLIGVDPLFVNAAADDYRLGALSPAVDFGDRTLASTALLDAAHAPRVAGLDTDAGAFERDGLFGDGFESADTGAWSAAVP